MSMAPSDLDIKPAEFALDALELRGALVDRNAQAPVALLPPEVAMDLGLPEEVTLSAGSTDPGALDCGYGTALLDRLIADARAEVPAAVAQLDVDPPRPAHVKAAVSRLSVRNGLFETGDVMPRSAATYALAVIAWTAESDDRHEGLIELAVSVPDGGAPDKNFTALLDVRRVNPLLLPSRSAPPGLARVAGGLVARAKERVREQVEPARAEAERRYRRDYDRIARYFEELVREARAPRRKVDAEAVRARVAVLLQERDAKLRDLLPRFRLRVSSTLAAVLFVEVPAVSVRVTLRRRKETREMLVGIPGGAQELDALACEGCLRTTLRPALCDARLHILCEACAPSAQGRVACPACG